MCSKGFDMAGRMSEQAPFDPQQHRYSYEEFRRKKETFEQNISCYEAAQAQIASLRVEAGFDPTAPL